MTLETFMNKKLLSLVAAAVLTGSIVFAETIQLPYQAADDNGNQWVVYYQGQLQQQGNQPVFSQAGMINVNGKQPQQQNQQANYDEKTKTVSMVFRPQNNLKHERQFRFSDDGIVRIIDIFENTSDKPQSVNLQYTTNTNYGVNGADTLTDPKKKGDLGWAADTGAGRAAMSVWGGKGSKLLPTVRYNPGNNQVMASVSLSVGGKQKSAIVHWHGTMDNIDAAKTWVGQSRESRLLSDVPVELRKVIANVSGTSAGSIGDRELLRGDRTDIIELRGGDQIRGDLKVEVYKLNTAYGKVELPAAKVASLLSVGDFRARQLLVTQDGEIFGGDLETQTIPIQLSSGQTTQVPLSQISRLGYRTGGAELPEWTFDKPMVFLRSGERCAITAPDKPIDFVTRYGALSLKPQQVAIVNLKTESGVHEIYLSDGSRMSGIISNPQWALKLSSTSGDAPVQFALAALARVQIAPLAEDVGAGKATLSLMGDDIIATRLEGELSLQTTFDTLKINAAEIRSMARPDEGLPDVQITMFDQSTFRGTLQTQSLKAKLVGGLSIDVPVAAVRGYDNPQPFPAASVVTQVKEHIAKLAAEDWKDRESAEAAILAMGPIAISVLDESLASQNADVKQRMGGIIKRLKKDLPPAESKLVAPEPIQ